MEGERAPRRDPRARGLYPLFPLPNVFLFPKSVMPLHVFEPRYRNMVEDQLDACGRIVLGTLSSDAQAACAGGTCTGTPPVHPIAGLGEIGRHERLPDGRFLIWLVGLMRVRIREAPSDHLYRLVEVEPLVETPVCPSRSELVREKLAGALRSRCSDLAEVADGAEVGDLTDMLLRTLCLPPSAMALVFGEGDVERRALLTLAEHRRLSGSSS